MRQEYYLTPEQTQNLKSRGKNWEKIYKYAKLMEQGVEFPPVKIFFDERRNTWDYNDGRNRVMAAKLTNSSLLVRSSKKMGENRK